MRLDAHAGRNVSRWAPILMYHSAAPSQSRGFRRFAIPAELLEEHARFLHEHGYRSLTVSGLVDAMAQRSAPSLDKTVVLTFDDGFEDFHTTALPILQKYGLTATLYVVTGCVGGGARWLAGVGEGDRRMLSWSQIAEIADAGVEVGAHTVTHAALDAIPFFQAREEIRVSKQMLEQQLAMEVRSFAYPFGFYTRAVRDAVEESGFDSACAVGYAMCTSANDRFTLSRHIAPGDATVDEIAALLAGRTPLPVFYNRARSVTWKMVRGAVRGVRRRAASWSV